MHYLNKICSIISTHPHDTAIIDGKNVLTYQDLYSQFVPLASYLIDLGIGHETVVGICMNKNADVICAMLSIMSINASFFLIEEDSLNPERIKNLENEGVCCFITNKFLDNTFSKESRILRIDQLFTEAARKQNGSSLPELSLVGAAYLLESSGSTGRKKKIIIEKKSIQSLFDSMDSDGYRALTGGVRLSFCQISFDVFIEDVLRTLCFGGCLLLPESYTNLKLSSFLELMKNSEVEHVEITPGYAEKILAHPQLKRNGLPFLKTLVLGGDIIQRGLIQKLNDLLPEVKLYNSYGTSETTINNAICEVIERDTSFDWKSFLGNSIPIIALDQVNGVDNCLFIGGDCLMRGYLNNPEQTKSRIQLLKGTPTFATYDKVSVSGDRFRILGRIDLNIKLNGKLVNYNDVENDVKDYLSLDNCVAVKETSLNKSESITIYSTDPHILELDNWVAQKKLVDTPLEELAQFLRYKKVDKYPLNSRGKINRNELVLNQVKTEEITVSSSLRDELLSIWQELFPEKKIDQSDDFFMLGANSIIIIEYLTRIEEKYQIELEVHLIYQSGLFSHHYKVINNAIISR